jgi:hypothetical protein
VSLGASPGVESTAHSLDSPEPGAAGRGRTGVGSTESSSGRLRSHWDVHISRHPPVQIIRSRVCRQK